MKNGFKKTIVFLSAVIAVGIACVVAGVAMGGSVSYQISLPGRQVSTAEDYISNSVKLGEFTDISVYESGANVRVEYGEDYRVTYKYRAMDAPHIEIKGNNLRINVESSFELRASGFLDETLTFFDFGNEEANELVITVPKDAEIYGVNIFADYGNVSVRELSARSMQLYANCGNVSLIDSDVSGNVYCDSQNGNVTVRNVNCGNFVGVPYNGNIVIDSFKAGRLEIVEAHCANAEIKNSTADEFAMYTDSGNLTVNSMVCNAFNIESKYGNADVKGLVTRKLTADNRNGNMSFELVGEKETYGFDISSSSSSVKIGDKEYPKTQINTDSEKLIKINADYANINIDFINE